MRKDETWIVTRSWRAGHVAAEIAEVMTMLVANLLKNKGLKITAGVLLLALSAVGCATTNARSSAASRPGHQHVAAVQQDSSGVEWPGEPVAR